LLLVACSELDQPTQNPGDDKPSENGDDGKNGDGDGDGPLDTRDAGGDGDGPIQARDAGAADGGADGGSTCQGERCPGDVTFYAFGDCQYGGGPDADKNFFQITAINSFAGTPWPEGMPSAGSPVAPPRGVMMAGDITQSGRDGRPGDEGTNQVGRFASEYGLTGAEGLLRYPIYEGYGNHDYDPLEGTTGWRQYYTDAIPPSIQAVIRRNEERIGLTDSTEEGGHYSWDWGGIHFVNTNIFPGNETSDGEEHGYVRNPFHSLDFLKADLEEHVGDSCRPVIVMAHFGFKDTPGWWTDAQKEKFLAVAHEYNVIAFIHGHSHDTELYQWDGIDMFNVGSPFYDTGTNPDGLGHFSVFRIHENTFEAADVAWDPKVRPTRAQFVSPTQASPKMGWRLQKTFKRTCDE
jgi:cytolysin (calcineurin-like family phosphatase)